MNKDDAVAIIRTCCLIAHYIIFHDPYFECQTCAAERHAIPERERRNYVDLLLVCDFRDLFRD
ncbi:hypothetical protein D3C71_1937620 [compost metagenome]